MKLGYLDIITIIIYFFIILIAGLAFVKKNKTIRDYAVGDKSFSLPLLVATIFATMSGSNTIFGTSERLATVGIIFALVRLGDPIYKLIIAKYITPRMGRFSSCISVGDLLFEKFGNVGKITGGFCTFIKATGSVAAQVAAISLFFSHFTGYSQYTSTLISSGIIIVYSSFGGVRSVVMTDLIQFGILLIGIPLLCVFSVNEAGGITKVSYQALETSGMMGSSEIIFYISIFVLSAIPVFNPGIIQRLLMTNNLNYLSRSFKLSAFLEIPMLIMVCLMVFSASIIDPNTQSNTIIPTLIHTIIPIGFKGIVMAGILSLIMSTADSFLNISAVALLNDIIKPVMRNKYNDKYDLFVVKIISIVVGTFATISALYFSNIFDIYFAFLNFWVPVIVVPIYAVIFNVNVKTNDFIYGAIGGVSAWFLAKYYLSDIIKIHPLLLSLIANFFILFRNQIKLKKKSYFQISKIKKNIVNKYPISENQISLYSYAYFLFHIFISMYFPELFSLNFIFLNIFSFIFLLSLIFRDYLFPEKYVDFVFLLSTLCSLMFFPAIVLKTHNNLFSHLYCTLSLVLFFMLQRFLIPIFAVLLFYIYELFQYDFEKTYIQNITFIYFLVILFSIFFIRSNEKKNHEKIMLSDAIAAEIAHELRTHLQYIKMRSQFLKKSLPDFISKSSIKSSGFERLYSTPDDFIEVCDHSLKIIDSTLKKKNNQSQLVFSKFSLYSIICKAVEQYPYKRNTHKKYIKLNIESIKDKMILGNEDAVLNVFNNIISNALDAVNHNGKVIKEVKIYCSVLEKRICC